MKDKVKQISIILLITTLLFSSGGQMFGQGKVNISGGIGFPDLINIGIKYQVFNQAKIGFNIGYWPPSRPGFIHWNNLISLSGAFYYHFAGSSKFSDLRPWYGRIGFMSLLDFPTNYIIEYIGPYLRFGRDLYFDKNSGISIDGGIGLNFYEGEIYPFPTLGVCYFLRF